MRQKSELHQYQLDVLKLGTIVPNLSTITPNLGLFMFYLPRVGKNFLIFCIGIIERFFLTK